MIHSEEIEEVIERIKDGDSSAIKEGEHIIWIATSDDYKIHFCSELDELYKLILVHNSTLGERK